jgi:hypothetical protein
MKTIIHWDHKKGMNNVNLRSLYQYWDYTCRGFGMKPSDFVFIDLIGTLPCLSPPNLIFSELSEALDEFEDSIPVYIHAKGKTPLPEFVHPPNSVYIIGPNYDGFLFPGDDLSVSIPAWDDLWGCVALGIVLYDRTLK